MNKKAQNLDGIGMLFVIFIIIGVGVVIGILIFYSPAIDIRKEEAKTICDKLASSLVDDGRLKNETLREFDIFKASGLNEKFFYNGGKYYFKADIIQDEKIIKTYESGTKSFEVQCSLPGSALAKCYSRKIKVLGDKNEVYEINILAGSNNLGAKV